MSVFSRGILTKAMEYFKIWDQSMFLAVIYSVKSQNWHKFNSCWVKAYELPQHIHEIFFLSYYLKSKGCLWGMQELQASNPGAGWNLNNTASRLGEVIVVWEYYHKNYSELSFLSLATDVTTVILGSTGIWLGTRTVAGGTVTLTL